MVDGVLDEDLWYQVFWQGNTRDNSDLEPGDTDFLFAAVADDEYLYLGVQIVDDILVYGENLGGEGWQDDSFEFYLDVNNSAGDSYDEDDVQIRIPAQFVTGSAEVGGSSLAADLGIVVTAQETDEGWTAEIAIPLESEIFTIVPIEGQFIGFNAHYNDDDDQGGRDHKLIWSLNDPDDSSWPKSSAFGQLVFGPGAEQFGREQVDSWLAAIKMKSMASVPEEVVASVHTEKFQGLSWNFESDTDGWIVAGDSGVIPELRHEALGDGALAFDIAWGTEPEDDPWATAPRLKIGDLGMDISGAKGMAARFIVQGSQLTEKTIEVNPILQYPPSWWDQQPALYIDGLIAEDLGDGLVAVELDMPLSIEEGTELAHLLLVLVGAESGYDGTVYLDYIELY